ncbi:MAG: hypothetical protein GXO26_02565 [Crenarchaeota archaeon]|nr:hypothetical protein [Thermoproteota archaeon]
MATAIYYIVITGKRTQQLTSKPGTRGNVLVILYPYFRWEEYYSVFKVLKEHGFNIIVLCMTYRDNIVGVDLKGRTHIVNCNIHFPIGKLNYSNYKAVVFVGGPGLYCVLDYHAHELGLYKLDTWCRDMLKNYLENSETFLKVGIEIARKMYMSGHVVAAICVAPVILCMSGLLKDRPFTMYRCDVTLRLVRYYGCTDLSNSPVVKIGKIVTGCGPEAAQEFAETILKVLENVK